MMQELWVRKKEGIISLAVLIAIVFLVIVFTLSPLVSQADRYRAELVKDARILQQLRAIDAARDSLESTFQEYQTRDLKSWVYSQERADTVTLDIQRRVSVELANASAQVRSISPLAVKSQNGYSTVGVEVNFTASMYALMQLLKVLEQEKPLLVIDNVRISPVQMRRMRQGEVPEQLVSVQMTVQTFLVAENNAGAAQ